MNLNSDDLLRRCLHDQSPLSDEEAERIRALHPYITAVVEKLDEYMRRKEGEKLYNIVQENHSLDALVEKMDMYIHDGR